ncbi:HD domain-containing phosphohydrolase [Desulfofalx alkaliphila]|uniref:HD domain-containing phosphohydrolase n=1 Tax=Desulfofalx alkaliphila TaxID=105483 RepID=UPI0005512BB4|nr:HD domain-containing phosphohydrolase [Desulfofalx alkaliphila]
MQDLRINFLKLLSALSHALDYNGKGLMHHHTRVALIAQQIAQELEVEENHINNLVYAAMLHDAGAKTFREKAELVIFEVRETSDHCVNGHRLMKLSPLLNPLAEILLCHHDRWDGGNSSGLSGDGIPLAGRIIHLADRVDVLIGENEHILNQRYEISKRIDYYSGSLFDPRIVKVFKKIAQKESFWLELTSVNPEQLLTARIKNSEKVVNLTDLLGIGEVFARIIDNKSPFTHLHSRLVSKVAAGMAMLAGYSENQAKALQLAGLLHDLGKLAVPESIIEKPGPLSNEEYNIIKCHTYYTYNILNMVDGFEEISQWAAYHHECLNGNGYPFKIDASGLSAEARLMAVSDIFTALVEDRPYRPGLPRDKVTEILLEKARRQDIDIDWVELLLDNYGFFLKQKEAINHGAVQ